MPLTLHDDEFSISIELASGLVLSRFPEMARLPLTRLSASGSTNVLFRLGSDLLLRLPRQPGGSSAIEKEYRWLPIIGPGLTVEVPQIIALGEPVADYPERWSIVHWIEGTTPASNFAEQTPASLLTKFAVDLADLVASIRESRLPKPEDINASLRCYRGRRLTEFDQLTRENIQKCRSIDGLMINLDQVLSVWNSAMAHPDAHWVGKDRWYHGDLVAENILVADGRLCALLDFGGLGIGDATVDLHGVWGLLDAESRNIFRKRLGVDDSEWLRGRAWALGIALNAITYYWTTMPSRMKARVAMVQSVLDDASIDN